MLFAAIDYMGTGNPFFSWLAAQPAFIEVGLGMAFCLVIAPALLAVVAAVLTSLEETLARILAQSGLLTAKTSRGSGESLRRAIARELPWLRKSAPKRQV